MTDPALMESYDFSTINKVVDIGGGHGSLLASILKANPTLKGVLFDLPEVVEAAREIDAGVAERCEIIGGDFFESVPAGGDAYILKQIIHDWNDDLSIKILQNCHKAMAGNGRVLVIDAVIQPGNVPDLNKFIDLQMLILTYGGRERTEFEFRSLFEAAGFELMNIFSTPSMFNIIEGRPN
jgi:SAM-dependent methyltransferase